MIDIFSFDCFIMAIDIENDVDWIAVRDIFVYLINTKQLVTFRQPLAELGAYKPAQVNL